MKYLIFIWIASFSFIGCTAPMDKKAMTGKELSEVHCASCHLFPEPGLLDKSTWKTSVLLPWPNTWESTIFLKRRYLVKNRSSR
ncbi:MAG: hypothetical protein WKI04_15115 [Ferruginibacter sp.]